MNENLNVKEELYF